MSAHGQIYEGRWYQDKKHYHGKEIWEDGSVFIGQYSDGYKNG